MPVFLDRHAASKIVGGGTIEAFDFAQAHNVQLIKHLRIEGEEWDYCLFNSPDSKSVEEFHQKIGVRCEWVEEVTGVSELEID